MLGGSLAAQPEHETISVKRMGITSFAGWNRMGMVYTIANCRLAIAECRLPIAS